jgi:hypothetical protein
MKSKRTRRAAAAAGQAESPRDTRPTRRGTRPAHPAARPPREDSDDSHILSWEEVSRTHRVRNGVYQREGRLVSLLTDFGLINPCYPDHHDAADPDTVHYVGAGRRGDQHLTPANRALLDAIRSGHAVPLFNKLSPGRWQHTGCWRVTSARHEYDERERRMLWRFTLKRVGSRESEV